MSLLGTAALFLLQGAQFLGIATVAVYAGAIVVTFLFVLMLAQPEGHAFYDRISWGFTPRLRALRLTAVSFAVHRGGVAGDDAALEAIGASRRQTASVPAGAKTDLHAAARRIR